MHWAAAALATAAVAVAMATASGSAEAELTVPHGPLSSFEWVALPEFGGEETIIYRSPNGRRVAAAFRESGSYTYTYPFDEFLIVTAGTGRFKVHGGPSFELKAGEVAYFREGMTVDLELSKDFADITMLVSEREVKWR